MADIADVKFVETRLPGVLVVEPRIHADQRGLFLETNHAETYPARGIGPAFVQDNLSRSRRGVLRGLHYQEPKPQGKLIQAVRGRVFDVAVDIRRGSPNFGRWVGIELSEDTLRQIWIPPGFAHGFLTLSEQADLTYKCTGYYAPQCEHGLRWDDPEIGIEWPDLDGPPVVSEKDAGAPTLADDIVLPTYEAPA